MAIVKRPVHESVDVIRSIIRLQPEQLGEMYAWKTNGIEGIDLFIRTTECEHIEITFDFSGTSLVFSDEDTKFMTVYSTTDYNCRDDQIILKMYDAFLSEREDWLSRQQQPDEWVD